MALWLIRAGMYGEHEQRFFADSACYLTWEVREFGADGHLIEMEQHAAEIVAHILMAASRPIELDAAVGGQNANALL
jgi:hypothetical protein